MSGSNSSLEPSTSAILFSRMIANFRNLTLLLDDRFAGVLRQVFKARKSLLIELI